LATIVGDETSIFLASESGHVIHFPINEINVLSGPGKGVIGIKLDDDDKCLGGALIGNRRADACIVTTSGGKTIELRKGANASTHRGGRGYEVVKRSTIESVAIPAIEIVNWEEIEEKEAKNK